MNKMHLQGKQMEAEINEELNTVNMDSLFASMQDTIGNLKDVILNALVAYGYYAITATLGLWGAIALSNLIGNLFFAVVVLVFGICVALALAVLSAEYLTPPTIKYGKIAVAYGSEKLSIAKSWINSKFAKDEVVA